MSLPTSADDPFGRDTSGSTAFRLTTLEIIEEAYSLCEIGTDGETLDSEQLKQALKSLNLMIGRWQAQGIHLWTYQEATLFPVTGKNSYVLEQVDCTNYYTLTNLTTAALAGATVITLDSIELFVEQEQIDLIGADWRLGLYNTQGNIEWKDVVSRSGSDVTIDVGLLEDYAEGASIVFYRDKCVPVERVLDARRVENVCISSQLQNEAPIEGLSHFDFYRLPNKDSPGITSQYYYQRNLPQGTFHVWATPCDSRQAINLTYERKMQDFVNTDDCPDLPKYWLDAIVNNLAVKLAVKYRVPPELMAQLRADAQTSLSESLNFDDEYAPMSISINGQY